MTDPPPPPTDGDPAAFGGGDPGLDTALLQAAVEDELNPLTSAELDRSMRHDRALAGLVAELRGQRAALRDLPVAEPPRGLGAVAGAKLERAVLLEQPIASGGSSPPPPRSADRGGVAGRLRWVGAIAAVLAVAGLGLFATGFGDDRPTLADMADRLRVIEPETEVAPTDDPAVAAEPMGRAAAADTLALANPGPAPAPAPAARRNLAGPSLERAEEVGLEAFLLPSDRAAAAPAEPAASSFRVSLLDSLSRGRRGPAVPLWAEAETYLKPLPAVGP